MINMIKSNWKFLLFLLVPAFFSFLIFSEKGHLLAAHTNYYNYNSITDTIYTNVDGKGIRIILDFKKGKAHNHPLMAVWMEDMNENYIQTLYVAQSIASSFFAHGAISAGKWKPGMIRRPAALPYWGHKRGIQAPDGYYLPTKDKPVPDAYTGATPAGDFLLVSRTDEPPRGKFRLLFEINQSWDWNQYWNNNRFPEDEEYKTSAQPALVYALSVDMDKLMDVYYLNPIGHSHYSGKDGRLYSDLSTLTSALNIAASISVRIEQVQD
jgi:hypothetical protein